MNYGGVVRGKDHIVRAGERVVQVFPPDVEPAVATDIRVIYEDEAIIVVRKPAPLPMHASGRFHRNTLQHLMNLACEPPHIPRPVHRLDANTTGIVLFARTRHFCRVLQRQFIDGTVEKRYLVRVTGHPAEDAFFSEAPISAKPGALGTHASMRNRRSGHRARISRSLSAMHDGTTLLEAVLRTGRTNQIRIHLWHLGFPVVGDPAYLPGRLLGDTQTLDVERAAAAASRVETFIQASTDRRADALRNGAPGLGVIGGTVFRILVFVVLIEPAAQQQLRLQNR